MITHNVMVDIDDVLVPTIDAIHDLAREVGLHDGSIQPSWYGWVSYGCTREEYFALWETFAESGGYLETAPIPGALEALRRLHWAGHRIHLVTARGFMSRGEEIKSWTHEWLEEYAVPHRTLTFTQDKPGAQESLGLAFDYAIDDSPKNVAALANVGVEAYLLNHAHNRDDVALPRVSTVDEFVDLILQEDA